LLSTRSTAVRLPPVATLSPEHRRRCLIDTTLGIRLVTICYDTRSDSVPSQPFQVGVVTEPLLKHTPGLFDLTLVTDRVIGQRFPLVRVVFVHVHVDAVLELSHRHGVVSTFHPVVRQAAQLPFR